MGKNDIISVGIATDIGVGSTGSGFGLGFGVV